MKKELNKELHEGLYAMKVRQKLSIFRYFHSVTLILFLTFASIFFALNFYNAKVKFEREPANVRDHYMEIQKGMLIAQVDQFTERIIQERNKAYTKTQKLIQMRVNRAYDIATEIYKRYEKTNETLLFRKKS